MSKNSTQEEYKTTIEVLERAETRFKAYVKKNKLKDHPSADASLLMLSKVIKYVKDLKEDVKD